MLEVRDLSVGYAGHPLLNAVSFGLKPKTLTVLLGPNGSGKTTLLKTIARLQLPVRGEILLHNKPIASYAPKELARHLALLPQLRDASELSVEALVSQGRYPHRSYFSRLTATDEQIVTESLKRCGIEGFRKRRLNTLSGGERQRVYLAMALAQDTEIILLDEPTTFLDIAQQLDVLQLLHDLCNQGKTLLAVLHDLHLALRYADRVLLLADGVLQANATTEDLLASGLIERVFRVQVHRFGGEQPLIDFSRLQEKTENEI